MVKVLPFLRTIFLILIVGYTVWVMPFAIVFSSAQTQNVVAVSPDLVRSVARAAWLAIGWIALETFIGWSKVAWVNRAERKQLEARASAPPPPGAPPPHR
jgi:hypothetical protein